MNAERRVQGWLDSPLDDRGRAQGQAVARRLCREEPELIYSSTLRRARETARIIAEELGIEVVADERLKERNVGVIAGMRSEEIEQRFPGLLEVWRQSQRMIAPPEGEQPEVFWARVVAVFDEIVARHEGGVVAVVTHGGVLATYLGHLLGVETGRWAPFSFANGSLSVVEFGGSGVRVFGVNDRCHLEV
jgi:probable phosphoglycerate mutase